MRRVRGMSPSLLAMTKKGAVQLTPALLLLLAACQKPTFDERYAEAEKSIRATAAAIDKELAEREKAEGGAIPSVPPAPQAPASLPAAR